MSLMRAMMETMDECEQLAIDRNKKAATTPADNLDDLPTEVTSGGEWSRTGMQRFPNPFPWNEVGMVRIDGDEAIRTEDGSCDCTVWEIVISSGRDGYGRCITFGVKGANDQGYRYAQEVLGKFHNRMPPQIRNNFVRKGDKLIRVS